MALAPMTMRLVVPVDARFGGLASAVTAKVAERLGYDTAAAGALGAEVETRAAALVAGRLRESLELEVEFEASDRRLVIRARCAGRTFEVERPLP
ncbi:MAG TPA: hypothetical protein VNI83_12805 [Vicinamibacterales bacterium]|nr:hypothetical protein [Vicinamibacterales bacterium]